MPMTRSSSTRHQRTDVAPTGQMPTLVDIRVGETRARPLSGRRRVVAGWMAVSDALCGIATLIAVHAFVAYRGLDNAAFAVIVPASAVVWVVTFHLFGLYDVHRLSAFEEFRRIVSATCVAVAVVVLGFWWNNATTRSALGIALVVGLASELCVRRLWRTYLRRLRRTGYLTMRTVVVGVNDEARHLADTLASPALGFATVGFVATDAADEQVEDLPIVGRLSFLDEIVRELDVDCVFVASSAVEPRDGALIASVVRRAGADLRISAKLSDVLTSRVAIQPLNDVVTLSLKSARLTGTQSAGKRAFDLVVGAIAFLLVLPIIAVIALAIRLTSHGPVLFRQERVTKDGKIFTMFKFRTMFVDQAARLDGHVVDLTEPFFKMIDDPRLTRVGRMLRAWSLDELPQLWHVLRGQLSLVGPRALWVDQIDMQREEMRFRHEVKAGLTGWWQVNGRSLVTPEEALRMDLFYINNWSFALDIYILLKTIGTVLARRGAQ
jgi:exopolysaccharide biosynthesis polyprenyl glycosylphosphotransferase